MHRIGLLWVLLIGLVPAMAAAQEPPAGEAPLRIFVSGGLGLGMGPAVNFSGPPLAVSAALTVNRGVHDFVLRAMAVGSVAESGPTLVDGALLYGRRLALDRGRVRAAGGLALTTYHDPDATTAAGTLGLAGQVDLVLAPSRFFGIGFTLIANINVDQPALGTLVTVHLGDLR